MHVPGFFASPYLACEDRYQINPVKYKTKMLCYSNIDCISSALKLKADATTYLTKVQVGPMDSNQMSRFDGRIVLNCFISKQGLTNLIYQFHESHLQE